MLSVCDNRPNLWPMNASLRWLNDYLDRPVDAEEADEVLTIAGFPVEGREDLADDVMMDFEVTSNRGDCLSHVGLARELAAATGRTLRLPAIELNEAGPAVSELTSVANEAVEDCAVYTARVITGVKVGPSPAWMVERLEAIGLRSVNNIVDITNFVLMEMGQPLHAFDLNKLAGKRIVVRRAGAGEAFTAIDSTKHKLRDDMLVIADGDKPVAVAGVMGGLDSEVSDATTDVLLESAIFAPLSVRTTSRALKLASDSSFRFERKVDPAGVERASRRAAQLMVELAGGTLAEGVIRVGEDVPAPRKVSMRPARCTHLLGVDVDPRRQVELLAALGLEPQLNGDAIDCAVPTFRHDLEREVDLIEEVARLYGFDKIPQEPTMRVVVRPPQDLVLARRQVGRVLEAHGFFETITFSRTNARASELFVEKDYEPATIDGDKGGAESHLRPSLLPSLLAVRKINQDAGAAGVNVFEVGHTFGRKNGQYWEMSELGLLCDVTDAGSVRGLRSTLEELCAALGWLTVQFRDAGRSTPRWAETAGLIVDAEGDPGFILGVFGRASAAAQDQFDLTTPVDLAWLDYDRLVARYPVQPTLSELPRYPGIERDLSIVVDEPVRWQQVAEQIDEAAPALLEDVTFIGTYRGKQVGTGRKSVTFRMMFRDPDKTLRHDEVDPQVAAVVERVRSNLNAELRA